MVKAVGFATEVGKNSPDMGRGPDARRMFPIEEQIRYQIVKGSRINLVGLGRTIEISSRKVRFTTQHTLKEGQKVRLAIDWPALLDKNCLMKLEIAGWIMESRPAEAIARIERHEFRTRGSQLTLVSARAAR